VARALATVEELRLEVAGLETQNTHARQRLEELRQELAILEQEESTTRETARSSELDLKGLEGEGSNLESRQSSLNRRRNDASSQVESLETRVSDLATLLTSLEERIVILSEESTRMATDIESRKEELEARRAAVEEARESTQTERRRLHESELEATRLTAQLQSTQKQLSQLNSKEDSLKLQIESLESDLRVKESERQATLGQLEAAFATRSDLETEKNAVDQELAQLESDKVEKQARRDTLQQERTVTRIRKEQLEALERNLDGVDATAKEMALKLREQGVTETLLADRVKVPASLEKAVEATLAKHLQRVLVSSVPAAEELKRHLGRSESPQVRQGRASLWLSAFSDLNRSARAKVDFRTLYVSVPSEASSPAPEVAIAASEGPELAEGLFPIAVENTEVAPMWAAPETTSYSEVPGPDGLVASVEVQAAPAPEAVETPRSISVHDFLMKHPDVIGPMDQLLKSDGETADWHALTEGTWVVRNLEVLKDILDRLEGLPLNWVTLDGDVLTADGFLDLSASEQGAEGSAAVGLVQRKREILDLRRLEEEQSQRFQIAQDELDACIHALSAAKDKFRALTQQLAALNPDVENYSRFLREVEARVARLTEKRSLLSEDLTKTSTDILELQTRIEETTALLHECETRRTAVQFEVERLESDLHIAVSAQKDIESSVGELSQKLKSVDRELADEQSKRAAAEQERVLSEARKTQLIEEVDQLVSEVAEVTAKLEEVKELIASQRMRVEEARLSEREAAQKVDTHKESVDQVVRLVEELGHSRQKTADKVRDLEQHLAVNDVEIRTVSEKLSTQYQIEPEAMEGDKLQELTQGDDIEELADPTSAKQRALQLRQKIDGLGKINMVAAEEYDDSSRRYEYLFVQRQDLFDAISQLEEAISRIDQESRTRFADAFNAVNQAFTSTFPLMFGGGQAELRLTNPDNMLETGVEIIAQPPGKKLQSVTLLSGGEKALTAVSLIFGIFSIKPSPFCVLDEVDAPLDDANVGRFNNQVREMCKISQVIMITHHKKTMESADALFGVTMERPGISKIASAKLTDIERSVKELRG